MKSDVPMDRLIRESFDRAAFPGEGDGCLSAETAAAWADGALDARERMELEAHAAACRRCQALLAMMIRTGDVAQAAPARARVLGWLLPLAVGAAAVAFWIRIPERTVPTLQRKVAVAPPAAGAPTAPPIDVFTAPQAQSPERRQGFGDRRSRTARPAPPASERGRDTAESKIAAPQTANEAPPIAADRAERGPLQGAAALADARAAVVVASPDPRVLWRIAAGRAQGSIDGGRTWRAQAVGVDALVAGAAPSSSTCWLVGLRGAVAVTSDGSSWRRVPFPDATIDLVAVQATSDKSAIVTGADGRQFRTSDGGATWVSRAPQEFPAAPF